MSLKESKACGAKLRNGGMCTAVPLEGRMRCRLHGGASTGPKTPEGRRRNSETLKARWREIHEALALAQAKHLTQKGEKT